MTDHQEFKVTKVHPAILLVGIVVVVYLLFKLTSTIIGIIAGAAPFILLVALIVNHKVVWGYIKWVMGTLKQNTIVGLIAIVFSVVCFPLVSIFLLYRALSSRGILKGGKDESFTKYEEVEEGDFLDISEVKEYEKKVNKDFKDLSS